MQAAILTIGDEILLGQITDTNSAYIAHLMSESGIQTGTVVSIADRPDALREALNNLLEQYELVLITGGLGPTKDDLTKKVLAEYFDDRLVFHDQTYRQIENMLSLRGVAMNALNREQAMLPSKAQILPNRKGTAAGMCFEKDGKIVISLPGVPFEMEDLMQQEVMPLLKNRFTELSVDYRLLLVYRIAESMLAEKLDGFERQLPENVQLAYLPSPGLIRLRLTAKDNGLPQLEDQFGKLQVELGKNGLSYILPPRETSCIEAHIGELLRSGGYTLTLAESCTGGYLGHLVTSAAGSSDYFKGSVIAYSNAIKEKVLGVEKHTLDTYGAVSRETVLEMAVGAKRLMQADFAIATSGIAGPGGGTKEKPVGTVWIAIASPWGCEAKVFRFFSDRKRNIERSSIEALCWLSEILSERGSQACR